MLTAGMPRLEIGHDIKTGRLRQLIHYKLSSNIVNDESN